VVEDVQIEVMEADGGLQADQLLNDQEFDIVFTDINMPGMDGLTLIDKWRDETAQTQWVILSGYDDFRYAQKAITLGVKEYILKPITRSGAQETLRHLIDHHLKTNYHFIHMNQLEDVVGKLEDAVWTLNEEIVNKTILGWAGELAGKEIEVSYLLNTLNNLLSILTQRLNKRGSILLEDRVVFINEKNTDALIESFQEACMELIEGIRIQRKGKVLDPIEFAMNYIAENLTTKLSLDDVANKLGLNPAYFSHLFKKETGTSFVEYRMQLRMEKALKLIDTGTMKITDIAISLGYEDLSHFTKTFKKYTGVSPSKYISTLELD
jgi:two-component system, response regulator YesN